MLAMARDSHDETWVRPDYAGGGIVNLMSSIVLGLGGQETGHPPLGVLAPARVAAARRVVLVVIDGLGDGFLRARPEAPVLHGGRAGALRSVFPPTTTTAVTTFLTGLTPAQHALVGWHTYFREVGAVVTVLPYTTRVGRAPLEKLGVDARVLFGLTSIFQRLPVRSSAVLPAGLADSPVSRALAAGAERVPFRSLGGFVRRIAALARGAARRRFVYAYWPELDRLAHRYGIDSPQASAHLAEIDRRLGELRQRLAGTDTLLLVTADHGFVDVPAQRRLRLEDRPALARSLVLPLSGEPRTAYCHVNPACVTGFDALVAAELGEAANARPSAALVEEGWFGPGAVHPRLTERVGDWTIRMRPGYAISETLLGETLHPMVGYHGGATREEMTVPLLVWEA
jgi:hypothetical protein